MCAVAIASGAPLAAPPAFDGPLTIADETIERASFDTGLQAGVETRGLTVRVGVAAHAERTTIHLHGVTGRVQFHASLQPITDAIARHHSPAP